MSGFEDLQDALDYGEMVDDHYESVDEAERSAVEKMEDDYFGEDQDG